MRCLYIIVIVLSLFILFGCTSFPKINYPSNSTQIPQECISSKDVAGCLSDLSLEKGDIKYCNYIPDGILVNVIRNNCIYERLAESGVNNVNSCTSSLQNRNNLDFCYNYVGLSTDNQNACLLIKQDGGRNWCLANIAIKSNDISKCSLIADKDIKDFCNTVIGLDSNNCKNINLLNWMKDNCVTQISRKIQNWKLSMDDCENMLDSHLFTLETRINYCTALINKDKKYCENINGKIYPNLKSDCRIDVNLISKDRGTLNFNGPTDI